jgi:hypothetical protein
MTDRTQSRAVSAMPKPSCIRSRRPGLPQPSGGAVGGQLPGGPAGGGAQPGSRRTAARAALDAALSGARLGGRDRQFLGRLVQWDKRNALSVAALLWRARMTGREEAALTPRQLDLVLGALGDAVAYRTSGAAAAGCWDCENVPGSRCADHARDADRARAYADVAAALSRGSVQAVQPGGAVPPGLPRPAGIGGYRDRTPVAS